MRPSFIRTFARDLAVTSFVAALLISKWCGAAEPTDAKRPRCTIVYINGDAVIKCPKSAVVRNQESK